MKYLKFTPIIFGLALLLYYYFGVSLLKRQTLPQVEQSEQLASARQKQWETKSDDQPPIAIKATPVEFGQYAKVWKFAIVLDTHSVDLNQDLMQIAILVDNQGNEYKPIDWEGSGPGGHHREGALIFSPVQPLPEYVELKISGIGDVIRSFSWQLK